MQPGDNNGWHEWSKHVLIELRRLNDEIKNLEQECGRFNVEMAKLKTQAAVWGSLAGFIVAGIISFLLKVI